jgi:hypothetical protein
VTSARLAHLRQRSRLAISCTKVVGGCFIAARLTSLGALQRAHLISSQEWPPFTGNAQSVVPSPPWRVRVRAGFDATG